MNQLPDEVKQFITTCNENAQKAIEIDDIIYVQKCEDGSFEISDNYDRFFSTVWKYTADKKWMVYDRGEERWDEYSFELAMEDASILMTG